MLERSLLRPALIANAMLSTVLGVVMTVAPSMVGGWLGVDVDPWLRVLGVALVGHGVALAFITRLGAPRTWAWINVGIIGPYPLLMVLVVAAGLVDTAQGRVLILADGVAVGLLAVAQWTGLRADRRAM